MRPIYLFAAGILITCGLQAAIISIPTDYPTIQQGVDAASPGDTVLVQPGIYMENVCLSWKSLTLASLYVLTQDTSYISQTIIDGNQGESVLWIWGNNMPRYLNIIGFTIRNGKGSGIQYDGDTPSAENLINFQHLIVTYNQGGINIFSPSRDSLSSILIRDVVLDSNAWSGGLSCENLDPILKNVICLRNSKVGNGGGCAFLHAQPVLENVIIMGNFSNGISGGSDGSGAYFMDSNPVLRNVLVCNNEGGTGGVCFISSDAQLANVTITAHEYGGIFSLNSQIELKNSIFWNNNTYPPIGYQIHLEQSSSCTVAYSDIQDGENGIVLGGNSSITWLDGNIQNDPLFLTSSDPPFQLSDFSPCVDAGTPDTLGLNLPDGDLIGNMRIWDGDGDGIAIVDMGAYEFNSVPVGMTLPQDKNLMSEVHIFPNPVNEVGNIEFNLQQPALVHFEIFNNLGKIIFTFSERMMQTGDNIITWRACDLSPGLYVCRLQTQNQMVVKRVVKL